MHRFSDRTESLILGRFSRRALRRGHHVGRRSGVAGSAGEERAMINSNAVLDHLSAAIEPSNDMIVLTFDHAYRNKLRNDPCAHSRRFHARLAVALRP